MALLVGLLVAVAVVVLVVRAAASPSGGPVGAVRRRPAPRPPRAERPRPLAPDDDPDFLRELQRRTRRDDPLA